MRRLLVAVTAVAAIAVAPANAAAPPVGPLPDGPVSTVSTTKGELVAFALPLRRSGLVWRIARPVKPAVLRQVSEATVGQSVVLVFRATGRGAATVTFGLTRGETARAYESRRYVVRIG